MHYGYPHILFISSNFSLTVTLGSVVTPVTLTRALKVTEVKTLAQSGEWLKQRLDSTVAAKRSSPKMH